VQPNADETHALVGLTAGEAETRLDQFGPNEPAATQHHSFLSDLLHVFMNPLVLILLIAAVVSAFMGEAVDAGIIGAIVLLSAAIDLSQTYRSQQAIEQLRDRVAPTATYCAAASGKKFAGVTWCPETSCGFRPETWFPRMRGSWSLATYMFSRQR
jgi:magnesium-transporting ATPase (P-type)